ncbi:MAG: SRPBCC family protein [Cyclobacteriaceae bacterium]
MKIKVSTQVDQDYKSVMKGFDRELFLKLNPPFPPVRLLRFDGCKKGDVVALQLNFFLFKQEWISLITEDGLNEHEFYFVDEGTKLPFFLSYWKHRHRIIREGAQSRIVDDISFRSPLRLLDMLLWPVLWLQFLYRKPIYRKIFRKKA